MTIAKTAVLAGLLALGLGCGYSKSSTPATVGTIPTVIQLSPNSMAAGSAMFALTVDGTNFISGATINWNGTALQTTPVVIGTQLMATIPASLVATAAPVTVTVTNPGKQGGPYGGGTLPETSNGLPFTIN